MKILLLLASSLICFHTSTWANESLNTVLEKIESPDPKIILGLKKMSADISVAISAPPGPMQYVQIMKALDSGACLANFYKEEMSQEKYKNAIAYLEPKFQKFDAMLKKIAEDPEFEYKDKLAQYQKTLPKLPKSVVCRPELR